MATQSASDCHVAAEEANAPVLPTSAMVAETLNVSGLEITVFHDFGSAAPTWLALEKNAIGLPYQKLDWVSAWQSTVGNARGIEPVLVIARDGDAFAFALPLGLERRPGYCALTFLGQENANQNTGLWNPDYYARTSSDTMRGVLEALCRHVGADLLHFINIPLSWENRSLPLLMAERTASPSPVFLGKVTDDFDSLFQKSFSHSSAKKLLRKQRKLEAAGDFRILRAETEEDIKRGLNAFFEQRAQREAETGIPSGFSAPDKRAFLEKLALPQADAYPADKLAPLSVWFLEAGGAIRATYVTIQQANRLIAYSNSIAQDELVAQSPGVVLLKNLVEAACNDPKIEILDLGLGDESYKHPWTRPEPLNDSFLACTFKGRLVLLFLKLRQKLKTRIRNSKTLWQLVRKIRRASQHLDT